MAIELRGVGLRVAGEVHIHPTDLALAPEGFNILLGTTLSGKTTLLRLMAGLERPSEGQVCFRGEDVTGVAVQRRRVSMVYQQFINYPNMSVFDNIASPLRIARLPAAELERRVRDIADLLRLTPMLSRRPSELSGGQQQRTALARALVKDADLVLLDEPLANLDYKLREELREELPRLLARRGATVVYATSEPQEALLLGGCTATLHEGRVSQFGPTAEIYRRPGNLLSARALADPPLNLATAIKRGEELALEGTEVRWRSAGGASALPDGTYSVALRPYHLTPAPVGEHAVRVEGRVLVAELSGSESLVHVRVGEHDWVSQSHGVHVVGVGQTESLYLQADRLLYFDTAGELVAA